MHTPKRNLQQIRSSSITSTTILAFRKKIFSFYKKNARDLPWRKTTNPYNILVSEVMLQQTQVDRVKEKYILWIKQFPDFETLAKAPLSHVLTVWSGLGYNSRAKRLQDLAKIVVTDLHGVLPDGPEELQKLPGIGPYTSKSILIFAKNRPLATVDTNIRRILMHEFSLPTTYSEKQIEELALLLLPRRRSRDWHNALMDYGSLVLTSKKTGIAPKTKQSTFQGSTRWYRGQILKLLTEKKNVTKKSIYTNYEKELIDPIIKNLISEGLICEKKDRISLPT
ncbi:MAG: Fe-S cluster assembly protein HesB [Candidatus Woesearchaeota archaeon]|nr:MAG: Fe-S cluster assembly protein HesB [Candidatus Woesearchaeota archaeon]